MLVIQKLILLEHKIVAISMRMAEDGIKANRKLNSVGPDIFKPTHMLLIGKQTASNLVCFSVISQERSLRSGEITTWFYSHYELPRTPAQLQKRSF